MAYLLWVDPDDPFDADGDVDEELDDEAGVSEEELAFCLSSLVLESLGELGFGPSSDREASPDFLA